MKIVAEDRIPFLRGVLEPFAEVVYLPGAKIGAADDAVEVGGLLDKAAANCTCVKREYCEKCGQWYYFVK